jgi:hypothetical protein
MRALQFLGEVIAKAVGALWELVSTALTEVGQTIVQAVTALGSTLYRVVTNTLQLMAKGIIGIGHHFISEVLRFAKGAMQQIGNIITRLMEAVLDHMAKHIGKVISKPLQDLIARVAAGKEIKGEYWELIQLFMISGGIILLSQVAAIGAWGVLHTLATPLDKVRIPIGFRLRAGGRAFNSLSDSHHLCRGVAPRHRFMVFQFSIRFSRNGLQI